MVGTVLFTCVHSFRAKHIGRSDPAEGGWVSSHEQGGDTDGEHMSIWM